MTASPDSAEKPVLLVGEHPTGIAHRRVGADAGELGWRPDEGRGDREADLENARRVADPSRSRSADRSAPRTPRAVLVDRCANVPSTRVSGPAVGRTCSARARAGADRRTVVRRWRIGFDPNEKQRMKRKLRVAT